MEKSIKPENLFIARKRLLCALAAIVFLSFGIALAVATPLAMIKTPPEDDGEKIFLIIAISFISAVSIIYGILNARNLFFPYLLTADEKGIYNYSGLFHFGFISWDDVGGFTKDATILDVLDGDGVCLRIFVRDFKEYKRKLSLYKKLILFFSGLNIKIYTLCSQINRKELFILLNNMYSYYKVSEDDETVDLNE